MHGQLLAACAFLCLSCSNGAFLFRGDGEAPSTVGLSVHQLVNESQLVDDCWCDYEGIKIALTHGAVDAVYRKNKRYPRVDDPLDAICEICVECDGCGMVANLVKTGSNRDPTCANHFQRVDDMQVMGPRLGEIFPRMCSRIF